METKKVIVKGMKCDNCRTSVENGIRNIPGIRDVEVDLQKQEAVVTADHVDLEKVESVIRNLGYSYGGEK